MPRGSRRPRPRRGRARRSSRTDRQKPHRLGEQVLELRLALAQLRRDLGGGGAAETHVAARVAPDLDPGAVERSQFGAREHAPARMALRDHPLVVRVQQAGDDEHRRRQPVLGEDRERPLVAAAHPVVEGDRDRPRRPRRAAVDAVEQGRHSDHRVTALAQVPHLRGERARVAAVRRLRRGARSVDHVIGQDRAGGHVSRPGRSRADPSPPATAAPAARARGAAGGARRCAA